MANTSFVVGAQSVFTQVVLGIGVILIAGCLVLAPIAFVIRKSTNW